MKFIGFFCGILINFVPTIINRRIRLIGGSGKSKDRFEDRFQIFFDVQCTIKKVQFKFWKFKDGPAKIQGDLLKSIIELKDFLTWFFFCNVARCNASDGRAHRDLVPSSGLNQEQIKHTMLTQR